MLTLVHDALHARGSGLRPGRLALFVVVGLLGIYGSLTTALPRVLAEVLGTEQPAFMADATASEERSEHDHRVEGPEATLALAHVPVVVQRTLAYALLAPRAVEDVLLPPPTPPPLAG